MTFYLVEGNGPVYLAGQQVVGRLHGMMEAIKTMSTYPIIRIFTD